MNEVMNAEAIEVKNVAMPVSITAAVQILMKAAALEVKRGEAAELRKELIALLPECDSVQFGVVLAAAKDEKEIPEGYQPNVDFRLTPTQVTDLAKVKEARRKYCEENKTSLMAPVMSDPAHKLVSLTVRQGKSKVTTTARFEKKMATSKESRGLLAQLARATAQVQG